MIYKIRIRNEREKREKRKRLQTHTMPQSLS